MAKRRKPSAGLVADAAAGRITLANTRRGSLRRAAVDIVRAQRGLLTDRNTDRGTPERQAVDWVTYKRRAARRAEGETVRQALGHRRGNALITTATIYVEHRGEPALLYDAQLPRKDLRRAARHQALVGQLTEGRLSPRAFRARVRRWRSVRVLGPGASAGEYKLLSDPEAVLVIAEAARRAEPEWIHHPNAALRRRRVA